jgi:hypothetical protein
VKDIKRYQIFSNFGAYRTPDQKSYDVEEHPRGEFVRYEDHKQALKDRALTEQEREVFNTIMSFFSESESEFLSSIKKKVLGEQ